MHPVANATVSASIAGAGVGLAVWILSLFHIIVPDVAVGYLTVLVTAGGSYLLHTNTQPGAAAVAAPAVQA